MLEILKLINEKLIDGNKSYTGIVLIVLCRIAAYRGWVDPYTMEPVLLGAWGLLGVGVLHRWYKFESIVWWRPERAAAKRIKRAPKPKRKKR